MRSASSLLTVLGRYDHIMNNNEFPGKDKKVTILGVPLGYGAAKMGSELGVDAMRLSRVRGKQLHEHLSDLGYSVSDAGNAEIIKPERPAEPDDKAKYLKEIVASFANVSKELRSILADGSIPIILGGDHSINSGTFSAVSSFYKEKGEEIGLVWFDAPADINTPETRGSGDVHGCRWQRSSVTELRSLSDLRDIRQRYGRNSLRMSAEGTLTRQSVGRSMSWD